MSAKPFAPVSHPTDTMNAAILSFPMAFAERPQDETSDAHLVRSAQSGQVRAFEALYRRHVGRVHGAVWRLSGNDAARAEEITQEAFIRAWQKLSSFRFESAFSTWLHRLAVNVALMDIRSRSSQPAHDDGDDALQNIEEALPAFCAAERGDLERAVAALPPRARAVLVLHDIEGWKHEEIAGELGMAVGSSKAQLHRARGILRRVLGEAA